jgi:hypothetical protein
MYERDDITVISDGLLRKQDVREGKCWGRNYMIAASNDTPYHKFRRFDSIDNEDGTKTVKEVDEFLAMKLEPYFAYIDQRAQVVKRLARNEEVPEEDRTFRFRDDDLIEHTIEDVSKSVIYLIDLDMPKLLPKTYADFKSSFRLNDILPGGNACLMHLVPRPARNFMGPNLYLTPPLSFTSFHQDGHGTVDSGHLNMGGYNEVVMLRRVPTRHKVNALSILTGTQYDGLYREPHEDDMVSNTLSLFSVDVLVFIRISPLKCIHRFVPQEKPGWPTVDKIQECRDMG